jgi:hypothetical protein
VTTTWVVKIILDPAASSMEIPLGIGFFLVWFHSNDVIDFAFCVRGLLANLLSVPIFIALFYKPICTKSVFFSFFFAL